MSKIRKRRRSTQGDPNTSKRFMWFALAAAGLILIGIVGLLATRSSDGIPADFVPEVEGAPRISVVQDSVDYGDVKLNTTIETVFRVKNVGDQTLYILDEPQVELVEGC